jgi:g-D-glutamyl-meso-diaminopimelate peptidase
MQTLRFGDNGLLVQYLQTALSRAKEEPGEIDGIFGRRTERALARFQTRFGLRSEGVTDRMTWTALYPYLCGVTFARLSKDETAESLAQRFSTETQRILDANPDANWTEGEEIVVPLPFDVVFTDLPYSSFLTACVLEGLSLRYPFLKRSVIGSSVMGRRIEAIEMGNGSLRVGINASHHANEWITTPLVLLLLERYAQAYVNGGAIGGAPAHDLFNTSSLTLVPLVNPDGVDLVTGMIGEGDSYYESAKALSAFYPSIPFPSGWKANIRGVDLNLGYPTGWENARRIKYALGFTRPGPRDYVGTASLEAPEDRAMYELTQRMRFDRAIAYHTQGGEIYWEYQGYAPDGSYALAGAFAKASGYRVAAVPQDSSYAGYKDWVIGALGRQGFTVEAGEGENPLPIADLPALYAENEGIFTTALQRLTNT